MSSQDDLEWEWKVVSYHEAGHAVAAVVLDLDLHGVEISARTGFGGATSTGVTYGDCPDFDDPEWVDARMVSDLAGAAAEVAFTGNERDAIAHAQGDLANAESLLPYSTLTLAEAEKEAHLLVAEHWEVIVGVAEGLREADGYMSGAEVEGIVLGVAA